MSDSDSDQPDLPSDELAEPASRGAVTNAHRDGGAYEPILRLAYETNAAAVAGGSGGDADPIRVYTYEHRAKGIAFQLWPAAAVLCRFIIESLDRPTDAANDHKSAAADVKTAAATAAAKRSGPALHASSFPRALHDQRILELGAGCGLVGMLCARLMHRNATAATTTATATATAATPITGSVVITDMPQVVTHLNANIVANIQTAGAALQFMRTTPLVATASATAAQTNDSISTTATVTATAAAASTASSVAIAAGTIDSSSAALLAAVHPRVCAAPLMWGETCLIPTPSAAAAATATSSDNQRLFRAGEFDLILLSDCIYWESLFDPLIFTFRELCIPPQPATAAAAGTASTPAFKAPLIYLAQMPRRTGVEKRFFVKLRKAGFTSALVAAHKFDAAHDRRFVMIYEIKYTGGAAGNATAASGGKKPQSKKTTGGTADRKSAPPKSKPTTSAVAKSKSALTTRPVPLLLDRLPSEVLVNVLLHLSSSDLIDARAVCRVFKLTALEVDDRVYEYTSRARELNRLASRFEKVGFVEALDDDNSAYSAEELQRGFNTGFKTGAIERFGGAWDRGVLLALSAFVTERKSKPIAASTAKSRPVATSTAVDSKSALPAVDSAAALRTAMAALDPSIRTRVLRLNQSQNVKFIAGGGDTSAPPLPTAPTAKPAATAMASASAQSATAAAAVRRGNIQIGSAAGTATSTAAVAAPVPIAAASSFTAGIRPAATATAASADTKSDAGSDAAWRRHWIRFEADSVVTSSGDAKQRSTPSNGGSAVVELLSGLGVTDLNQIHGACEPVLVRARAIDPNIVTPPPPAAVEIETTPVATSAVATTNRNPVSEDDFM